MNTITPATLEAFRDHGRLRASLEEDVTGARHVIAALESTGISLREVTDKLLEDGVTLFCGALDKLLMAIDRSRRSAAVRTVQRDPRVT